MNALAIRDTDEMGQWGVIREQASVLVKSGFLPQSIKTPEQALAIILTGRELGIGTMAALRTIQVIQGTPTIPPQLMLALINKTNQVDDVEVVTGPEGATCTIKRKGRAPYTGRFGPKEAQAMGLSAKDNYKKQPATMYKWRAVADAARITFPDVILGMYTPDEMGATVDVETGEVIDLQPEPTTEPEPATVEAEPTEESMALADEKPDTAEAELRWLAWKLDYSDEQLMKWLVKKYNINKGLKITEAIFCLGDGELREAIAIFSNHVKAKGATQ